MTIGNAGLMTYMENHLAYYKLPAQYRAYGSIPYECRRKVMLGRTEKKKAAEIIQTNPDTTLGLFRTFRE